MAPTTRAPIPPPEWAFAIWLGFDMTPRSYNEMRAALDVAYRWMQLYEIPPREVYEMMRRVHARTLTA